MQCNKNLQYQIFKKMSWIKVIDGDNTGEGKLVDRIPYLLDTDTKNFLEKYSAVST